MNNLIKKMLNKETISYLIFGVLTTAVDYIALALLYYKFNLNEIISNTIAWAFAVLFAYITNKLFVFNSKSFALSQLLKEFPSFVLARVFSLVITNVFLFFTTLMGMHLLLSKAIISVAVIILNYIFSKLFIFNKKNNTEDTKNEQALCHD